MVTINEPLMVDGDHYGKMLLCLFRQGKCDTGWKMRDDFTQRKIFLRWGIM